MMGAFEIYSNDHLVDVVERGLRKGYWDKALIPELKKRLKKATKDEKLLKQYQKIVSAIVRTSIEQPIYVIRISDRESVEHSFNRIKEIENEI